MSYAGMGQLKFGVRQASTGLTVNTSTTTSAPTMVDVGIPPELVKLVANFMWGVGMTMGAGDPSRTTILLVAGPLRTPRLNTFGLVDPASVAKALNQIPATTRAWLERPNSPSVNRLLADITAGKYAGHAPSLAVKAPIVGGVISRIAVPNDIAAAQAAAAQKLADAQKAQQQATLDAQRAQTEREAAAAADAKARADQAAVDAAAAKVAADAAAALAQQPVGAQVQCTDGYFRDASGLCVPNAAPPGPPAQPDVSHVTPVDLSQITSDFYGPPGPGPGSMIDGSGLTRTCPDGTVVHGAGVPCPTPAPASSAGLLGISMKWWVLGAVGVGIAAIAYRSSNKSVTANKRRRGKKRS